MGRFGNLASAAFAAAFLSACATLPAPPDDRSSVAMFESDAQIDAYTRAQKREAERERKRREQSGYEDMIVVTGSRMEAVPITNVQEQGVDEGGIVKATTDHILVLRKGRLHTIRHGGGALEEIDSIAVYPPGDDDPDDTWYDEMLLFGDVVVVIGYSYGESGTEISRFSLSEDGRLAYRDTHYLRSDDYYSSRNYASRLVDGHLLTYTPTDFGTDWREELPYLERRQADGSRVRVAGPRPQIGIGDIALANPDPRYDILHAITSCDLAREEMACTTRAVVGSYSRNSYFSADAAYVWTGGESWSYAARAAGKVDHADTLYRIPLRDSEPMTAVAARGSPIDQFSFLEDAETGNLLVLLRDDDLGEGMWQPEFSDGATFLVSIPLDDFGDGSVEVPPGAYRALPTPEGWRTQNRYVGRFLLYGGGFYGEEDETPELFVVPLDRRWAERIALPHGVSRIDRLGEDGVVIGPGPDDALGFSTIALDAERRTATVTDSFALPSADEGENRSHAFFFRPDAGDPEGSDGVMALPVARELDGLDLEFLGSSSEMFFLRRNAGKLAPAGSLAAVPDERVISAAQAMEDVEDCEASCIDWYGNARPIFIGDRIFALMGYEIVEGRMVDGEIEEVRRVDFMPR